MKRSLNLVNLKQNIIKSALLAIALTASAYFIPDSANAATCPRGKFCANFSGTPNAGETELDIDLNLSVLDSNIRPDVGVFRKAVLGVEFTCLQEGFGCPEDDLGETFSFGSGDLISSRLGDGAVEYRSTQLFDKNSNFIQLAFFLESTNKFANPDFLPNFRTGQTVLVTDSGLNGTLPTYTSLDDSPALPFTITISGSNVTEVPEPTSSLILGVGTLALIMLSKRSK